MGRQDTGTLENGGERKCKVYWKDYTCENEMNIRESCVKVKRERIEYDLGLANLCEACIKCRSNKVLKDGHVADGS